VSAPARRALEWGLAILLGAVFVYASVDKILEPVEFAKIVYHYRLIGPSQQVGPLPANLVAVTLPWIELVVGLLLASGVWRREAAVVAAAMLVAFLVAVGAAMARGIDLENCGCFSVGGDGGRSVGLGLLVGDALLLAAALWLTRRPAALTTPESAA
jgi:uncharacterized membrane protein YphA (DoxX/SURF4 family)